MAHTRRGGACHLGSEERPNEIVNI